MGCRLGCQDIPGRRVRSGALEMRSLAAQAAKLLWEGLTAEGWGHRTPSLLLALVGSLVYLPWIWISPPPMGWSEPLLWSTPRT